MSLDLSLLPPLVFMYVMNIVLTIPQMRVREKRWNEAQEKGDAVDFTEFLRRQLRMKDTDKIAGFLILAIVIITLAEEVTGLAVWVAWAVAVSSTVVSILGLFVRSFVEFGKNALVSAVVLTPTVFCLVGGTAYMIVKTAIVGWNLL